jgi:hypothetical protein
MSEPAAVDVTDTVVLETFLANLQRAGRGVVRVAVGAEERMSCTGWMLTDSLVIIPAYAVRDPQEEVWCRLPGLAEPRRAEIVHVPPLRPQALTGYGPALLRLTDGVPDEDRTLPFHVASVRPGEPVVLLHYPLESTELQVSLGRVVDQTGDGIQHDAQSASGSGGAPLISPETGDVVGMDYAMLASGSADRGLAIGAAELVDWVSRSGAWPEIARRHRLAGVATTSPPDAEPEPPDTTAAPDGVPPPALLRAAMAWTFPPGDLPEPDREAVRPYVEDPGDPEWSLVPEQRPRLIAAAGSLEELRRVRGPATGADPGDRTVDRILAGPPYDLATVPDDELPYWLQAVPWFAGVVPGLPTPAATHRELQARRIRGRLRPIATPRLWGRDAELERLREWCDDPAPAPMVVTGIGGVGKSALVARFALDLPDDTVILWLDFDRPDLAPDNAVSVLTALTSQLAVQREDYTAPPVEAAGWPEVAAGVGRALRGLGALLVLDGFEVAQHAQRDDELWGVLERVMRYARDIRVVVSGRAPVPDLELVHRRAETLPLTGLPPDVARAWLVRQGVTDPEVLDAAVRICDGVPLLLKLAVRLVEAGGDAADFPATLSRELVDGYLYQRILFRVVERSLQSLAHDALVLRRITRDVLDAVLHDRLPDGLDAAGVVSRLTRELALVENAEPATSLLSLRMRPEVRIATLRLLETEDAERVAVLDRRAADWWARAAGAAGDAPDRAVAAAETVYHRARLGDVAGAAAAWVEGCESFLAGADAEVPERFPEARAWLHARLTGVDPAVEVVSPLVEWEVTALRRIRDALARGLERTVRPILDEHEFRRPDSPLTVYDAWALREAGEPDAARRLLRDGLRAGGPVGWARSVVAARTAALAGDRVEGDRILADVDPAAARAEPDQVLAVTAARIRFATDLVAEARLMDLILRGTGPVVPDWDAVLSPLRSRGWLRTYERLPPIPEEASQVEEFALWLEEARRRTAPPAQSSSTWRIADADADGPVPRHAPEDPLELAEYIVELSGHRWRLALRSGYLTEVRKLLGASKFVDQLRLALAGTMAAYASEQLRFADGSPVSEHVFRAMRHAGTTVLGNDFTRRPEDLDALLRDLSGADIDMKAWRELERRSRSRDPWTWTSRSAKGGRVDEEAVLLLVFGPEPLEQLERRVLGLPELKPAGAGAS